MYLKGTILQEQCKMLLKGEMEKILEDEEAEAKLIPKFAVGCKRVIPSGFGYLKVCDTILVAWKDTRTHFASKFQLINALTSHQALKRDNVTPVFGGVKEFTRTGVICDDGSSHSGQVIICATGYDTSYVSRYPIHGPQGRNLQTEWSESIMGYMGVGVAEFPNTFTMLGPYSPVSNGPTLIAIEAQADYICSFVDRFQIEPIHSLTPKLDACTEFKAHVASAMAKMVWTDNCRNSHNNHKVGGRVPTTWPGSTLHYLEAIREPRWDDWEVKYAGNRFGWLGNGISQTEWDPTADLGYYIRRNDDGGLWHSRWKRNRAMNQSGTMPPRALHRQEKLVKKPTGINGEVKETKRQMPRAHYPQSKRTRYN